MKTDLIKFTTLPLKNLRGILAGLITTLIFFHLLPKAWSADLFWLDFADSPATAGGGFWATGEFGWRTSQTSTPNVVWADGSVAHFLGSGGGTVFLESNVTAAGIDFDPAANAFTINTNGFALTITGAGIVNTSGNAQTIINSGVTPDGGSRFFFGASSAGNVTIINNGDSTQFHDLSNAGSATITNIGGTGAGSGG